MTVVWLAQRTRAGASGGDAQECGHGERVVSRPAPRLGSRPAVRGGGERRCPTPVKRESQSGPVVGFQIELNSTARAMVAAAPVALTRAICHAVRTAGHGGLVAGDVTPFAYEIIIGVLDSGPGMGRVPMHNSLGLTSTRARVSSCGGAFELSPELAGSMVALIVRATIRSRAVAR